MLNTYRDQIHKENLDKGWWRHQFHDPKIHEPALYEVVVKLALIHSELSEALEGLRKDSMDDKLPHRKMVDVELVDVLIRLFDLSGRLEIDIDAIIEEKRKYNSKRLDHDLENRLKTGGKRF